jgi:hypothetical protein
MNSWSDLQNWLQFRAEYHRYNIFTKDTMSTPFQITGKCSTFGGPRDEGVGPDEDLAMYDEPKITGAPPGLFLPQQPANTTGTARRLNPAAFYCAMRWAYSDASKSALKPGLGVCLPVTTSRQWLKTNPVLISNPKRPEIPAVKVFGVDWGPNSDTGRIVDLSPGVAAALQVETDGMVTVTIAV